MQQHTATPKSVERQVLPSNVRPFHYDLKLEPDFDICKFEGSVSIDLGVSESSN